MAMECATFTSELADLLAGPFDATDPVRRARVAALARHATDCGACRGAAALVDLAAVAPGARAPLEEPGSEFWSSFGRRLDARVEAEEGRAARARRVRLVAAAIVLLAFGALAYRSLRREVDQVVSNPPSAVVAAPSPAPAHEVAAHDDQAVADALAQDPAGGPFESDEDQDARGLKPGLDDLDEELRGGNGPGAGRMR